MQKKKILIVGPAWVGDMVMAQPLMTTLKQQFPSCQIDVLAPLWSHPLLERMPEVTQAWALLVGHGELKLRQRKALANQLRLQSYDSCYVLPNSFKSGLIPFMAKIPERIGYLGEMRVGLLNRWRRLDKSKLPLMVQRFVALAYEKSVNINEINMPAPRLIVSAEKAKAVKNKFHLHDNKPVLALCPGAEFGPSKRWPEQHFANLANAKIKQGWQIWLFGSAKDKAVTDLIQTATHDRCHNLAGLTTLEECIDLLSQTTQVVSNDSGLMHIANALNKPTVVVYGSTDPGFTPPLGEHAAVVKLPNLSCSPCFKRECPLQHHHCMQQLEPSAVLQALEKLPS